MSLYNLELVVEGSEKLMIGKKLDKSINGMYFYSLKNSWEKVGKTASKKISVEKVENSVGKVENLLRVEAAPKHRFSTKMLASEKDFNFL